MWYHFGLSRSYKMEILLFGFNVGVESNVNGNIPPSYRKPINLWTTEGEQPSKGFSYLHPLSPSV
jgi:hypothetical protein